MGYYFTYFWGPGRDFGVWGLGVLGFCVEGSGLGGLGIVGVGVAKGLRIQGLGFLFSRIQDFLALWGKVEGYCAAFSRDCSQP